MEDPVRKLRDRMINLTVANGLRGISTEDMPTSQLGDILRVLLAVAEKQSARIEALEKRLAQNMNEES